MDTNAENNSAINVDTTDGINYHDMNRSESQVEQNTNHASQNIGRTVRFNEHQDHKFLTNEISTAKYNFITFIPKFLFEQFRRYANFFFLIIALLQQIPNVSPTGRYTTAVPLLFIILVSALKEIVEDFKRHRADDATNNSQVTVCRNGVWITIKWKEVIVGDFVKVTDRQHLPADLVIISSSEPQAMCYIETSNLDGETNLKLRQGLPETSNLQTHDDLAELRGHIECESPSRYLYEFVGNIYLTKHDKRFPIGPEQLLLRGAAVKNTKWVFGVVIYSGHETKVMLNSTTPPLKRSTVEKKTNFYILGLFGMLFFLTVFTAIANTIWTNQNKETAWYLAYDLLPPDNFGYMLLTAFIMFHTIIPISLQVSLEVVRFIQAFFINWDLDMYYEPTDTPAMARTSNLNEELGQVKYIFSDKTGTLTRNIMEFKCCSIAGISYGNPNDTDTTALSDELLNKNLRNNEPNVDMFMRIMTVCHTVVPEVDPDSPDHILYQASSPDEDALVKAARNLDYVFYGRTPEGLTIKVNGQEERYELLNVLEFTSVRKRMSVIVRDPNNKILLFTKGADTVIYERLCQNSLHRDETMNHLEEFAKTGLRTLCFAYAEISPQFYESWKGKFNKASTSLVDREKCLEQVAELIEKNLYLIGVTAIEDKLQEGVPEAIASLAKADIKIWVLTGDKQETAVNIGYSCRLLTQTMSLFVLQTTSLDTTREELRKAVAQFGNNLNKENDVGLVIDGDSLKHALTCDCRQDFLDLARSCKAVICCRVSPLQKAEVVGLVRSFEKDSVTLAIGDGANDVGMIQAAHVGVGISGMEGLQAACSSDYAIAQFRYLSKLILVHGAWNYHRITKLILYSFYKNVCLYLIQFWFAILSGFSGQIVFERWTIGLYNVIFTAWPPIALGLFDRSCSAANCLKYPQLYKSTQSAQTFNLKVFCLWVLNSVFHSAVLFWLTVLAMKSDVVFANGQAGSLLFLGNSVYTYVVICVCLKCGLEYTAWTWISHLAIWGSILSWFIFFTIYTHVYPTLDLAAEMVGMDKALFSSGVFWFGMFLIPTIALTRDIAWKALRRSIFFSLREHVMQMEQMNEDPGSIILSEKKSNLNETARLIKNAFTRSRSGQPTVSSTHSEEVHDPEPPTSPGHRRNTFDLGGYAFSQEEGGAVSQAALIRAYDTSHAKPEGL